MISTAALQKRIDRLELRPATEPDLVEKALAALEDKDLELLQEHAILRESGFNEEQAAQMMGERWLAYEVAATNFREGYQKTLDKSYKGFSSGTA